jgi:hypothetical protein
MSNLITLKCFEEAVICRIQDTNLDTISTFIDGAAI